MPVKFSDQLRKAIADADKSIREIGASTDIDPATLSRFMHGKGGLSVDGLDRLADFLKLKLVERK